MYPGISSIPRFLYLNSYAFLLILIGGGIAVIPCYRWHWSLVVIQAIFAFMCLYYALKIFSTWQEKKRVYKVLIERNEKQIRPETFNDYMQAPCGRLLAHVVLKDLGRKDQFAELDKLQKHFWQIKKSDCLPKPTKIVIHNI